jgi:hypothetical protein
MVTLKKDIQSQAFTMAISHALLIHFVCRKEKGRTSQVEATLKVIFYTYIFSYNSSGC